MERREPSASAPAAAGEGAARRGPTASVPFSENERQQLRNALIHNQSIDEDARKQLALALAVQRKLEAKIREADRTLAVLKYLALPSIAAGEIIKPSTTRITPDPLDKIWRQVGGYLSESIQKVRSGSADD